MSTRRRLDADLVRRGLVASRTEAQQLIDEHRVTVNGAVAEKAARQVAAGDQLIVAGPPARFVGRGGLKLDHALETFDIDVTGRRALDAGASTGGFTDCLLQRGAAHVVAVDVGHGQLHERLREDPRVTNRERTNVRHLTAEQIGGPVDMVVGDLSFISLRLVIEPLVAVCQPGSTMVVLVKPQFEAGRAEVSRGRGVIDDPAVWERVRGEIHAALERAGCEVSGWTESPVTGADGNREFLVYATTPAAAIVTRVIIVSHHRSDDARALADTAASWLRERGHEAWMPATEANELGLGHLAGDAPAGDADLVLSLGGDGTMLRAVNLLDGAPVPLLGVNLGRLGYLTEVEVDEVSHALERFLAGSDAGHWHLDERMMLDVTVRQPDGTMHGTWRALNEAVVEKSESGHTISLLVRIDGEPFTSYAADGLIVSTPTGSTAYSLSARGPVVSPKHRALLVTPVAPHMLFDRSLVLDPSETVDIEVLDDHAASVAVDGRPVCSLSAGAAVQCVPSASTARFVRFGAHHYHQVLKVKFGLLDR